MSINYYKVLELPMNCSDDDIKIAYKKLVKKYHPDQKQGDDKLFELVNKAYNILSNKKKKRRL